MHQLIREGLFQVVPHAHAGGLGVGKQDVAFRLLAVVDHHVHDIAGLDVIRRGAEELLDRDEPSDLYPKSTITSLAVTLRTVPCRQDQHDRQAGGLMDHAIQPGDFLHAQRHARTPSGARGYGFARR
jgi:hypothetical protein